MAVTQNDIANAVGVKRSTVSIVLNNRPNPIKIPETTRQKIKQAAKKLGYFPNAAARALVTNRTGHIGVVLADTVTGGWTNAYFASVLQGVEAACQEKHYGVMICRHNLSDIESFVFPAKIGQRSVDGVVLLGGYIQAEVIKKFYEFRIPCITYGDNIEFGGIVPTVMYDIVGSLEMAVRHLVEFGHTRVAYRPEPTRRGKEVGQLLIERVRKESYGDRCEVTILNHGGEFGNFAAADHFVKILVDMPKSVRPTGIIANDQILLATLKKLPTTGISCPKDISFISPGDTQLCEFAQPGLTAIWHDLEGMGATAGRMLIAHLDDKKPLSPDMSRSDFPFTLTCRESCGPPPVE